MTHRALVLKTVFDPDEGGLLPPSTGTGTGDGETNAGINLSEQQRQAGKAAVHFPEL